MKDKKLSYLYSFRCGDDLQGFDRLPKNMQGKIEKYIVKVITDSFIQPADEDYVAARLLAQKGMYRAFFWAAAQALEKYLKAFLLMRGESVKSFNGHPIANLHEAACKLEVRIAKINTKPHTSIQIHPDITDSFEIYSIEKFIDEIEIQGSSDNRYNATGVIFNSGHLFALDTYIYGLRQLIGVPPIQEALIEINNDFVKSFYNYNPWFAQGHIDCAVLPNENFKLNLSMAVTTLDLLTSPHAPNETKYALEWLNKKMKLPGKVAQHSKLL